MSKVFASRESNRGKGAKYPMEAFPSEANSSSMPLGISTISRHIDKSKFDGHDLFNKNIFEKDAFSVFNLLRFDIEMTSETLMIFQIEKCFTSI